MIAEYDGLLRAEGRYSVGRGRIPVQYLAALLVVGGFLYGLGMGSFSGRPLQALYSGLKVPILLTFSTAVCMPSFFVLNTLLGLRDDFRAALTGVLAAQATVATVLLAFLPVIVFVYSSSGDYRFAIFINGVFFALASLAGQRTLSRHYQPLLASNRRHEIGRWSWIVLYVFVTIQLAWVLRPFIGSPGLEVSFFREGAWSNAYVVIVRDVLGFGSSN